MTWIRRGCWLVLLLATTLAFPAVGHAATVQTFLVPTPASGLAHIAAGPDGALWFTEQAAGNVGRITTSGQITEYPIPNATGLADTGPDQIARAVARCGSCRTSARASTAWRPTARSARRCTPTRTTTPPISRPATTVACG
jgi:streptogramin lyase